MVVQPSLSRLLASPNSSYQDIKECLEQHRIVESENDFYSISLKTLVEVFTQKPEFIKRLLNELHIKSFYVYDSIKETPIPPLYLQMFIKSYGGTTYNLTNANSVCVSTTSEANLEFINTDDVKEFTGFHHTFSTPMKNVEYLYVKDFGVLPPDFCLPKVKFISVAYNGDMKHFNPSYFPKLATIEIRVPYEFGDEQEQRVKDQFIADFKLYDHNIKVTTAHRRRV